MTNEEYRLSKADKILHNCPACEYGSTTFPETGQIECKSCGNRYTHAHVAWVETPRDEVFWGLYFAEKNTH
jgi:hypothetical protein